MSTYSARWRTVFGVPDAGRLEAEIAFLRDALPLPAFRRVLDVPCGEGRHVRALTALGYDVVGVDNDPAVSPPVLADVRELDSLPAGFDAVINMWASFGYFDAETNARVLGSLARRLRLGGRLVLDLFNRAFFEAQPRQVERDVRPGVVERSRIAGDRRRVELDYGDGEIDVFEWQLYRADDLEALGAAHGLTPIARATDDGPSMRLVLQRDV